jgi:DNA-directed RNA polymerase subunit RPC12/RpoP
MSNSIYFVQECPTCGRSLQIRVEYLGRRLVCEHCHGRFVARDPASAPLDASDDLLRRADALLQSLDTGFARRTPNPR